MLDNNFINLTAISFSFYIFLYPLLVRHFVLTICSVHTTSSSRTVRIVPEHCSEALDRCSQNSDSVHIPVEHDPGVSCRGTSRKNSMVPMQTIKFTVSFGM